MRAPPPSSIQLLDGFANTAGSGLRRAPLPTCARRASRTWRSGGVRRSAAFVSFYRGTRSRRRATESLTSPSFFEHACHPAARFVQGGVGMAVAALLSPQVPVGACPGRGTSPDRVRTSGRSRCSRSRFLLVIDLVSPPSTNSSSDVGQRVRSPTSPPAGLTGSRGLGGAALAAARWKAKKARCRRRRRVRGNNPAPRKMRLQTAIR